MTLALDISARGKKLSITKLREAARHLFVTQGYDRTRPQDIARLAGLANGTFYIHFKDKRDAFLDFAAEAQNTLISEFRARLSGIEGRDNRWKIIFEVMEEFAERHPGVLEAAFMDPLMIAPQDEDAWRVYDRIGHFVVTSIQESREELSTDYDLEMIGHAICGLLRHAMIFATRKGKGREKMVKDLICLLEKGLYKATPE